MQLFVSIFFSLGLCGLIGIKYIFLYMLIIIYFLAKYNFFHRKSHTNCRTSEVAYTLYDENETATTNGTNNAFETAHRQRPSKQASKKQH